MGKDPEDKGLERSLGDQAADRGDKDPGGFQGEDQHGFSPDVGQGDKAKEGGDKAFEAHDTQEGSKSEEGAIVAPEKGAEHAGESVTARGEERGRKRDEPGLEEHEDDQEAGRPRAKATPRFSTGVNPVDPVDKDAEDMPPGDQGG